jgi:hypothetical protein
MREALFKNIGILRLPKPPKALFHITKLLSDEDYAYSFSREGWQWDEANYVCGMGWLETLYM